MSVWTINQTSYEMAKDILKTGDFEDLSPFAVCSSRDKAEKKVLEAMNFIREECPEDRVIVKSLRWFDCHTPSGVSKIQWKFYDEFDETVYTITEHEIDG